MSKVIFKICIPADKPEIANLLWSLRTELLLDSYSAAEKVIDVSFEKGGALGGYIDDELVAMLGYFLGDPADGFADKGVGFIYVTGIARQYQMGRLFLRGMAFTMPFFKSIGIHAIRCQASVHDPYTNRLYSRFAQKLGQSVSLNGKPAIQYGSSLDDVLTYMRRRQSLVEIAV